MHLALRAERIEVWVVLSFWESLFQSQAIPHPHMKVVSHAQIIFTLAVESSIVPEELSTRDFVLAAQQIQILEMAGCMSPPQSTL